MAQTLTCDMTPCSQEVEGQPAVADWLVSRLDGTLNEAYCQADFEVLCLAVAQTVQERMAAGPELVAEGDQDAPDEPTDDDGELDSDVASRLEAAGPPRSPADSAEASTPTPEPEQAPGPAQAAQGPTTVVKRGTSRSRRAHQARKREREQAAQEAE